MATYPYEKLEPGKREFRLLHIRPQPRNFNLLPVECTIEHVALDSCPEYHAISYVWGNNPNSESIIINRRIVNINQDLAQTLSKLRDFQERVTPNLGFWWIDALCINQKDDKEKSWQVQQMRRIYDSARSVFVWFKTRNNHDDEYSIQTMRTIYDEIKDLNFAGCSPDDLDSQQRDYLNKFIVRMTPPGNPKEIGSMPLFKSDNRASVVRSALGLCYPKNRRSNITQSRKPSDTDSMQSMLHKIPTSPLVAFFCQPWWRRVWVQQEVAVSKDVYFVCGLEFIDWLSVQSIWYMLRALRYEMVIGHAGHVRYTCWNIVFSPIIQGPSPVIQAWEHTTLLSDGISLWNLLLYQIKLSTLESSDPRDKVFAMLGLANDPEKHRIIADYSEPARVLFAKVTKAMIKEHGLGVLGYCSGLDLDIESHSRVAAPSWIPTWFVELSPVRDSNGRQQSGFINISNSSLSEISSANEILTLGGHFYDEIKTTGSVLSVEPRLEIPDDVSASSSFETISKWLLEIKEHYAFMMPTIARKEGRAVHIGSSVDPAHTNRHSEQNSAETQISGYRSQQEVYEALWRTPIMGSDWEDDEADLLRYEYDVLTGTIDPPAAVDIHKWRAESSEYYRHHVKAAVCGTRWFVSSKGYLGLGRPSISPGDLIAIFNHSITPFIVRSGKDSMFRLLGSAQIFGVVDSEATEAKCRAHLKILLY